MAAKCCAQPASGPCDAAAKRVTLAAMQQQTSQGGNEIAIPLSLDATASWPVFEDPNSNGRALADDQIASAYRQRVTGRYASKSCESLRLLGGTVGAGHAVAQEMGAASIGRGAAPVYGLHPERMLRRFGDRAASGRALFRQLQPAAGFYGAPHSLQHDSRSSIGEHTPTAGARKDARHGHVLLGHQSSGVPHAGLLGCLCRPRCDVASIGVTTCD